MSHHSNVSRHYVCRAAPGVEKRKMMKIRRQMSGEASIFLDLLRLVSAIVVLIAHTVGETPISHSSADGSITNGPSVLEAALRAGHAAVIVFFVLSGFVIALTTMGKNRDGWQYAQARLSRLYSVLLPALVLSAFVSVVLGLTEPAVQAQYTRSPTVIRFLLSSTFLNEIWFFSSAPPINRPLWSLGYEFWYYLIFGLWVFRGKTRASVVLPILACLIAGPKIIVLFPIWLMGCAACYVPQAKIKPGISWVIIACLCLLVIVEAAKMSFYPFPLNGRAPWFFSAPFLSDYVTGITLAVAIWLLPTQDIAQHSKSTVFRFRQLGDLTFSIYLLHFPLVILFKGLYPYKINAAALILIGLSVTASTVVIGRGLESKRPFWRVIIGEMLENIKRILHAGKLHADVER